MDVKKTIFGIQHIGLPTADVQKTIDFYAQFGFDVDWETGGENKGRVAFLRNGNCVYETYQSDELHPFHGAIDHISLDVTDIEAVFEYVKGLGYESLEGKICFLPFYANGVRFFTIVGPNGEKVEFNQML